MFATLFAQAPGQGLERSVGKAIDSSIEWGDLLRTGLVWLVVAVVIIIILVALFSSMTVLRRLFFMRVQRGEMGVIERWGQVVRVVGPGPYMYRPIRDKGLKTTTRLRQIHLKEDTRTQDNAFVLLEVFLQLRIKAEDPANAESTDLNLKWKNLLASLYSLEDPDDQIKRWGQDALRTEVAKHTFDETFKDKSVIRNGVMEHLAPKLAEYGFELVDVLITEIQPDAKVKEQMNGVLAAQRNRDAVTQQAEAQKTLAITTAEGHAQAIQIAADADAYQQLATAAGYLEAIKLLTADETLGMTTEGAAMLLLEGKRLDKFGLFAESGKANAIVVPSSGGLSNEVVGVASSIIAADSVQEHGAPDGQPNGHALTADEVDARIAKAKDALKAEALHGGQVAVDAAERALDALGRNLGKTRTGRVVRFAGRRLAKKLAPAVEATVGELRTP